MEPGGGGPGPFKGVQMDIVLLPESRLGNPMNHSNILLFSEAHAAYSGRAAVLTSLPQRARFLGRS